MQSYFTAREFECRCNQLDCDAPDMDPEQIFLLNTLRVLWDKPLIVTSGVRCKFWNDQVGGADESFHTKGMATDLKTADRAESDELAQMADKVGFGGIGVYDTWVHVDVGPRRRWAK